MKTTRVCSYEPSTMATAQAVNAPLVITPEEEEAIRTRLITQTAQTKRGVDYPIRRLAKSFFVLKGAVDNEDEGAIAEAREKFLIELDTYEFNMGRYSTVVAANREQQDTYDEEDDQSRAECAELKAQVAELKIKLGDSALERQFRQRRETAARTCAEYPSRATIDREIEDLCQDIADVSAKRDELAKKVDFAKKQFALLLRVADGLTPDA